MENCYNILQGKRGLVIGVFDERSIAWQVANRCAECGANVVVSATEFALEIANIRQQAESKGFPLIPCDMTDMDEINALLDKSQSILGGKIDFILHAVAQSENIRRHKPYDKLNYNYYAKTIDVSALSFHKLLRCAMDKDAISEYGSVVTITFLASERFMYGYNDMADAKAILESIVRQMGAIYGKLKGVRVNAISQSATKTKAGQQWMEQDHFFRYTDSLSPLGSADADDCANLCVALFSDLMRKVTMQTIFNDGGFSKTILTERIIDDFRKL